jgi:hypothetical protein
MLKTGNAYTEIFQLKDGDTVPVFYGKDKQLYRVSPDVLGGGLRERVEILENNVYKATYFEIIDASEGTSGSFQLPANAILVTEEFPGGAVTTGLGPNNYPDGEPTYDTDGDILTANLTLDTLVGDTWTVNWSSSGNTAGPVALVFQIITTAENWSDINIANVIDYYLQRDRYDGLVVFCEEFVGDGITSVFTLTGNVANASFASGAWDAANIQSHNEKLMQVALTGAARAIYNKPFSQIEDYDFQKIVPLFNVGPTVTLQYAPVAGDNFQICYWYLLNKEDDLNDSYYRPDVTALAEAGYPYVLQRFGNRPLPQNTDLDSALPNVTRVFAGGRTTWTVTHTLNRNIRVQTFEIATGETVGLTVTRVSTTVVTISALGNIPDGTYRALIRV